MGTLGLSDRDPREAIGRYDRRYANVVLYRHITSVLECPWACPSIQYRFEANLCRTPLRPTIVLWEHIMKISGRTIIRDDKGPICPRRTERRGSIYMYVKNYVVKKKGRV